MRDWAYIRRERSRRADPACPACEGDGNDPQDDDYPCFCAASFEEAPDPLADEGNSDARELARERF